MNVAVLLIISGTPSYVYISAAVMDLITCPILNRLQIACQCIMSGLVCRAQRYNIRKLEISETKVPHGVLCRVQVVGYVTP